ncbi:MAG: hypothetical protein HY954_09905 [Deltaproteobacteria bacterium]|nr:hypothetical protein [Deltaproteobacteria bacterium]
MPENKVNRDLLFDFFMTFAKFEYALKASGYLQRSIREAKPDWDRFAQVLQDKFDANRTNVLENACSYILMSPPNKQVVIGLNNGPETLAWETPMRGNESEVVFLIRMVRCVRNNLFHGGKHSIELHENIERTEALLRSTLVVIKECLILSLDVNEKFDEAII